MTPFEFAVACGLITAARTSLTHDRHLEALRAGQAAINAEKANDEAFKRRWREVKKARQRGKFVGAPKRHHTFKDKASFKPTRSLPKSLKAAGTAAYEARKREVAKRAAPDVIRLSLSRCAILRHAGLPTDGASLDRVAGALARLCHPITINGEDHSPVLLGYEERDGQLDVEVSGDWLPVGGFGRVPMPLPTRSPPGLALYLFLRTIQTGPTNDEAITMDSLCERLGIEANRNGIANQALHRALDAVNRHLGRLPAEKLRELGIKVPAAYEIRQTSDGRLRFVAVPRRQPVEISTDRASRAVSSPSADAATLHKRRQARTLDQQQHQTFLATLREKDRAKQEELHKRVGTLNADEVELLEAFRDAQDDKLFRGHR